MLLDGTAKLPISSINKGQRVTQCSEDVISFPGPRGAAVVRTKPREPGKRLGADAWVAPG